MFSKIKALWDRLPVWVQKALTDAVETGMAVLAAQALYFPTNFADLKAEAITVAGAVLGAALAALRRAIKAQFADA